MANTCGHSNVEMHDCDGYCTECEQFVGEYTEGGDWRWFAGMDPSVYRANLLAIRAAWDPTAKKALQEIIAQLRAAL